MQGAIPDFKTGLGQEKALLAGKIVHKILLVVCREPPAFFSLLACTLDSSETSLDGAYETLQLGGTLSSCDTDALRDRPECYFHQISGIKLVSTIIWATFQNDVLSEREEGSG